MSNKDACNCDQAKDLQSELDATTASLVYHADVSADRGVELDDLRAAAYGVLAWIDRSHTVSREAAERLERALAVGAREAEPEVVGEYCGKCGARQERHVKIGPGHYRAVGMTAEADIYVAANPGTGERARIVATIRKDDT